MAEDPTISPAPPEREPRIRVDMRAKIPVSEAADFVQAVVEHHPEVFAPLLDDYMPLVVGQLDERVARLESAEESTDRLDAVVRDRISRLERVVAKLTKEHQ